MNKKEEFLKYYESVDEEIKEDIVKALSWATKTLTELEGSGHIFTLTASKNLVVCAFAKPEWSGEHYGEGMFHGAEAVVMAVAEYVLENNNE